MDLVPVSNLELPVVSSLGGKVGGRNASLREAMMVTNKWGIPMADLTVEVEPGKVLTVDEIIYGYDLLFESLHLFSYTSWGRVPMQQDPQDAMAIADLLGRLQPDCFVELGTNTGGGAIFYAEVMKWYHENPLVVTLDVHEPTLNWDKRWAEKLCPHCVPVTCHPAWHEEGLIKFVQGWSHDPEVIDTVERHLTERQCQRTVVMHDSDHRRETIESDLQLYSRFVTVGSYLIVQDTKLSRMLGGKYETMEAVHSFLETPMGKGNFVIDKQFEYMLFSHHHDGYMLRVK